MKYLLLILALFVIIAVGIASASIPDVNGNIQACYKNSGGALRAVNSPSDCLASETSLQWPSASPPTPSYISVRSQEFTVLAGADQEVSALCPTGYTATGGGYNGDFSVPGLELKSSRPEGSSDPDPGMQGPAPNRWSIGVHNSAAVAHVLTVFVVCVSQ